MSISTIGFADLDYNSLYAIPLGGQSEMGLVLWAFIHQGKILLVDAGASYPAHDLPGVDLLLPSTSFLEANQEHILGQVLTNGHEEHMGAIAYLIQHVKLPRVLCPKFVANLIEQEVFDLYGTGHIEKSDTSIEVVEQKKEYRLGPFSLEWIECNNSIADACALRISCQGGTVVYTSGFKLDQTPVDGRMLDIGRLAAIGDEGVMLLISCSANVEEGGYSASEKVVASTMERISRSASGRLLVVMPGTNTHRLQVLFDVAQKTGRKLFLQGETLHKVAVCAAISGHLQYDRAIEGLPAAMHKTADRQVLLLESSKEADPIDVLEAIAYGEHKTVSLKEGDTLVFSSDVVPGEARRMANILDELMANSVHCYFGTRQGVHVSRYGAREELKLMLSVTKPRYFAPAMGESRHLMQHGQLGEFFDLGEEEIFNLSNGDVLELRNGKARHYGHVEAEAVLFNRDQGERVTTASVKERQALSLEGVLTVGLTVGESGKLVSGPNLACGAAGFLLTDDWQEVQKQIAEVVEGTVDRIASERQGDERDSGPYMRSAIRESVVKVLRNRLGAKPTVQILIHQV